MMMGLHLTNVLWRQMVELINLGLLAFAKEQTLHERRQGRRQPFRANL